jgi:hypothetical protein
MLQVMVLSAVLVLGGCKNSDELADGTAANGKAPISFRIQGGAVSSLRATTTPNNYINTFVVNAIRNDLGWTSVFPDKEDGFEEYRKYLMHGVTVYREEVDGTNGTNAWEYAPEAYFPGVDPLDGTNTFTSFYAYSPAAPQGLSVGFKATVNDRDVPILTYTVQKPDTADTNGKTTQQDLLVAYEKVLRASYTTNVALQFRHALSRVNVKASKEINAEVVIKSLKLINLYSEGDLSLKGNTETTTSGKISNGIPASTQPAESDYPKAWVYKASDGDWSTATTADYVILWTGQNTLVTYPYVLPASGVYVQKGTAQNVTSHEQGMYVLPQTTILAYKDAGAARAIDQANSFGLELWYTIGGKMRKVIFNFKDLHDLKKPDLGGEEAPYAGYVKDELLGVTFEIGRQYVLNITFSKDNVGATIEFETNVDDYIDGGPVSPHPAP